MTMQRHSQSLGYSKEELNRLNQAIQRLTVDVDRAESQPGELEGALQEEGASGSAKVKLAWLEAALQRSRQDMARQLREYQELMVVKLGLDFEIATCRKLLEGEERRLGLRRGAESLTLDSDLTCPPGLARGPDRLLPSGEEHSWLQRLTLRLPRPCQGIQLQRLPRTLNTSSPAPRTLAFAPKTWSSVSDAPPMDLALASFLPRVPHPGPQSLSLAL